jgi:hypothetical protein
MTVRDETAKTPSETRSKPADRHAPSRSPSQPPMHNIGYDAREMAQSEAAILHARIDGNVMRQVAGATTSLHSILQARFLN